jgi:hypothetical protein
VLEGGDTYYEVCLDNEVHAERMAWDKGINTGYGHCQTKMS